jgi:hypothetical protein
MFYKISDRAEDEYGESECSSADSMEPVAIICVVALLIIIGYAAF